MHGTSTTAALLNAFAQLEQEINFPIIRTPINPEFQHESRRRLFNIIVEHIMPELNRLQRLSSDHAWSQSQKISTVLRRTYEAIQVKNGLEIDNCDCDEVWGSLSSIDIRHSHPLLSISQILNAKIGTWQQWSTYDSTLDEHDTESGYLPDVSLREALNNAGCLSTVETTLAALDVDQLLSENPNVVTVLNKYIYSSEMNPRKLCQLAQKGDLNSIRKYNFGSEEVNTLVGWAVWGDPPSFLGDYNALLIAASYRHFDVVKYFVEEKNADVTLKGGRNRDFTALDCAKHVWWTWLFNQQISSELIDYLNSRQANNNQTENTSELQQEQQESMRLGR